MDVSLNFSPLCGGKFTTGGRIQSGEGDSSGTLSAVSYSDPQSLESWIKRTIVNADLFDLSQLCIREGHSAWKVNINCMVINHDGNIVDACILGIMMALKDLRLPAVTIVSENSLDVVQILQSEDNVENRKGTKLKLSKIACSATIAMFQGKLLVDPTLEEEIVSDGMITVVVDLVSISEDADTKALNGKMISLSKSGGGAIVSGEEIAACVQLAFGRAKELQSILLLD
jgi:exosome complex RNA-binding protein Rrp42 (RNase PH superfamily)